MFIYSYLFLLLDYLLHTNMDVYLKLHLDIEVCPFSILYIIKKFTTALRHDISYTLYSLNLCSFQRFNENALPHLTKCVDMECMTLALGMASDIYEKYLVELDPSLQLDHSCVQQIRLHIEEQVIPASIFDTLYDMVSHCSV